MKYEDPTDIKHIYHRMYRSILNGDLKKQINNSSKSEEEKEQDRKFFYSTYADSHIIECAMRLMDKRVARCNSLRTAKDVKNFIIKQREIAESVRRDFEKEKR